MPVKRRLSLEPIEPVEVQGVVAGKLTANIRALPIEIKAGKKVFVFMMAGDERKLFTNPQIETIAQTLGNAVHPAQCAFIVVPEGSALSAYEVRG